MKLAFPGHSYCIDTSSLIDLADLYPRDVFPTLWSNLAELVEEGRLVAPREVSTELEAYQGAKDEPRAWARRHPKMFRDLDEEQQKTVLRVLRKHPRLVDSLTERPEADPFVIALAVSEGCTVITSEKRSSPGGRPKIPDVCEPEGVGCVSLKEFFRERRWEF